MQYALAAVTLGRTFTAALVALAFALALSACGGKGATTSETVAGTSGATATTGSTADTPASNSETQKKSGGKSSSQKSSGGSSGNGGSSKKTSNNGGSNEPQQHNSSGTHNVPQPKKVPPPEGFKLTDAQKQSLETAFNKMIDALDKHDVSYLCGTAYSKALLASQEKQGGCAKYTQGIVDNVKSWSAKIISVGPVPATNKAQVWAKQTPVLEDKGQLDVKSYFFFTPEDGMWKRDVPQAAG